MVGLRESLKATGLHGHAVLARGQQGQNEDAGFRRFPLRFHSRRRVRGADGGAGHNRTRRISDCALNRTGAAALGERGTGNQQERERADNAVHRTSQVFEDFITPGGGLVTGFEISGPVLTSETRRPTQ